MSHSATPESAILARQSPGSAQGLARRRGRGGTAISLVLTYLVVPLERTPAGQRSSEAHRQSRSFRRTLRAPRRVPAAVLLRLLDSDTTAQPAR